MFVCYDIADPKRLNKTAKVILDYGHRVQKSKYLIQLSHNMIPNLVSRIEDIIDPLKDGVKYLPICERCFDSIEIIGKGRHMPPDKEYYIL